MDLLLLLLFCYCCHTCWEWWEQEGRGRKPQTESQPRRLPVFRFNLMDGHDVWSWWPWWSWWSWWSWWKQPPFPFPFEEHFLRFQPLLLTSAPTWQKWQKSPTHDKHCIFHGEQWWAGWWRSSPERVKEAPIGGGPFLSKVEKAGVDEINVVSVKKSIWQKNWQIQFTESEKYVLNNQRNTAKVWCSPGES